MLWIVIEAVLVVRVHRNSLKRLGLAHCTEDERTPLNMNSQGQCLEPTLMQEQLLSMKRKNPLHPTWTELLETGGAGALMSGSVCRRPAITGWWTSSDYIPAKIKILYKYRMDADKEFGWLSLSSLLILHRSIKRTAITMLCRQDFEAISSLSRQRQQNREFSKYVKCLVFKEKVTRWWDQE